MKYKVEKELNVIGDVKEIKSTTRKFILVEANSDVHILITTEKTVGTTWYFEFKDDQDETLNTAILMTDGKQAILVVEKENPDKFFKLEVILGAVKNELPEEIKEITVRQ